MAAFQNDKKKHFIVLSNASDISYYFLFIILYLNCYHLLCPLMPPNYEDQGNCHWITYLLPAVVSGLG